MATQNTRTDDPRERGRRVAPWTRERDRQANTMVVDALSERDPWVKRKSPKEHIADLAREQIPRIESELLRRGEEIPEAPKEEPLTKPEEPQPQPKKQRKKPTKK